MPFASGKPAVSAWGDAGRSRRCVRATRQPKSGSSIAESGRRICQLPSDAPGEVTGCEEIAGCAVEPSSLRSRDGAAWPGAESVIEHLSAAFRRFLRYAPASPHVVSWAQTKLPRMLALPADQAPATSGTAVRRWYKDLRDNRAGAAENESAAPSVDASTGPHYQAQRLT